MIETAQNFLKPVGKLLFALISAALLTIAATETLRLLSLYSRSISKPWVIGGTELGQLLIRLPYEKFTLAILSVLLAVIVFRWPKHMWATVLLVGGIFFTLNLFSGRHLLPQPLIQPNPVSLSRQYAHALMMNDVRAALRLTDQSPTCVSLVTTGLEEHNARLEQRLGSDRTTWTQPQISVPLLTTYYDLGDMPVDEFGWPPPSSLLSTISIQAASGTTIVFNLRMSYKPFFGSRYICGIAMDVME